MASKASQHEDAEEVRVQVDLERLSIMTNGEVAALLAAQHKAKVRFCPRRCALRAPREAAAEGHPVRGLALPKNAPSARTTRENKI